MLHIHAPAATMRSIRAGVCLDCGKRTRFAGVFTPWYGWRTTCLRCGRTWCDGEWLPLEFERGARAKSIASARRSYRRPLGPDESSADDETGTVSRSQTRDEPLIARNIAGSDTAERSDRTREAK